MSALVIKKYDISLQITVKCTSPCYELNRINLTVTNPFPEGGEFHIVLVESSGNLLNPNNTSNMVKPRDKRRKRVKARVDHGQARPETPPTPPPPKVSDALDLKKEGKDLKNLNDKI